MIKILLFTLLANAQVFTEEKTIDRIEVVESGVCQIREATITKRDGVEIARKYHRWTVEPDDNANFSEMNKSKAKDLGRVEGICRAAWTPAVIKKYKDQIKVNKLPE